MTSDIDIYRSAHVLIQQHGEGAAFEAAMKADAMLDKGDLDGAAVRQRIVAAINASSAWSQSSSDLAWRVLPQRHGEQTH